MIRAWIIINGWQCHCLESLGLYSHILFRHQT
jgi:hypothetical protein